MIFFYVRNFNDLIFLSFYFKVSFKGLILAQIIIVELKKKYKLSHTVSAANFKLIEFVSFKNRKERSQKGVVFFQKKVNFLNFLWGQSNNICKIINSKSFTQQIFLEFKLFICSIFFVSENEKWNCLESDMSSHRRQMVRRKVVMIN